MLSILLALLAALFGALLGLLFLSKVFPESDVEGSLLLDRFLFPYCYSLEWSFFRMSHFIWCIFREELRDVLIDLLWQGVDVLLDEVGLRLHVDRSVVGHGDVEPAGDLLGARLVNGVAVERETHSADCRVQLLGGCGRIRFGATSSTAYAAM